MSQQPLDRADLLADLAAGDHRCTARSKRTGERCQLPSMLGGNVCRSHGGAAPQTRAKAKRRLEQASDVWCSGCYSSPSTAELMRTSLCERSATPWTVQA